MILGVHTNSIVWAGEKNLMKIAEWAVNSGIDSLEIGPAIDLDERAFAEVQEKTGIGIAALTYCRNFLTENGKHREEFQTELFRRICFAGRNGIKKVVCSTGVTEDAFFNMRFDPEKSLRSVTEFLNRVIELAEVNDVKICIENCPMMGNIALSPYMWTRLFDKVKSDKLGLAFDPSHMVWQMMEPYKAILDFGSKIFHFHAKDTEILHQNLRQIGILHNITQEGKFFPHQWWRHRLPGMGDIDWKRIICNLYEIGYDGVVSIEHEDPVWEGSLEKVQKGILMARNHLRSFL